MNQYLFLYPIKPYFDACFNLQQSFLVRPNILELFSLINARYRNDGFLISWLLFASDDETQLDLSLVPNELDFGLDSRLNSGISFRRHVREKIYPSADFILDQLPEHKKLVLGGFHQWDCVDKIASRSYARGIDTFVDEDTTELFFNRYKLGIPLIRTVWTLRELGIPERLVEIAKEIRAGKPWFVQE